jgi:hypothetical protein
MTKQFKSVEVRNTIVDKTKAGLKRKIDCLLMNDKLDPKKIKIKKEGKGKHNKELKQQFTIQDEDRIKQIEAE